MIPFASRTGTRRNLDALRELGWRLLVSAAGVWRTEGFHWSGECGSWTYNNLGQPFDGERYERFLGWCAEQARAGNPPMWIVLPDIVCGGLDSLALSRRWYRKLRRRVAWREQHFMLVVQNGMEPKHVRRLVGPKVGIFVGGDTDWKLATMSQWVKLAHSRGGICHVGRVNSARRARLCDIAGADSFDGSGPSKFEKCLRQVDAAFVQRDLEGYIERLAA